MDCFLTGGSRGNRAYHYVELVVSILSVTDSVLSTHYAYLQRDGQAELASTGHPSPY